jgi:hypothetical protein
MLLLAVEKSGAVSWDYCYFFVLSFLREQATRPGTNHHTEIESHLNSELSKNNLIRKAEKPTSPPNKSETASADRLFQTGKFGELASFTIRSSLKISRRLANNRSSCRNCMPHRCSSGNFCRSSYKQVDLPQIQSRKSSPRKPKTEF